MSDLTNLRLVHAKGMRAEIEVLLNDPRIQGTARLVVEEHRDSCASLVASIEALVHDGPPTPPA